MHRDLDALIDAELERLLPAGAPAIHFEPEVLGGCSCGARFYSIEAAEEHECGPLPLDLPWKGEFPVDRASDMDEVVVEILGRNMRAGVRR